MSALRRADPNTVLAFLSVVEHASFRGAARALGVPKSTLSHRVSLLEQHLGTQLLARSTRSVQLTDIGARYHREAARAVAALDAAAALVGKLQQHPSGTLRMTAPVEFGQAILGEVLAAFAHQHPHVKLEVQLTDRHVQLIEEGFDLALRVGPLADSALRCRKLGSPQRPGIFASPSYLARAGSPAHPQDLAQHRCLVMSTAVSPAVWRLVRGSKTIAVPVVPAIAVNSFYVLRDVVLLGVGVARLPRRYMLDALAGERVVELFPELAPPPVQLFAVYRGGTNLSPAVRAMLHAVSAHVH